MAGIEVLEVAFDGQETLGCDLTVNCAARDKGDLVTRGLKAVGEALTDVLASTENKQDFGSSHRKIEGG
jgi:hypothetical protein